MKSLDFFNKIATGCTIVDSGSRRSHMLVLGVSRRVTSYCSLLTVRYLSYDGHIGQIEFPDYTDYMSCFVL